MSTCQRPLLDLSGTTPKILTSTAIGNPCARYSPPGNWWGEFEQNVFPINYVSPQPPNSTTPSTPPQQDPASPKPQPKPSPPSPWQSPGPHHPGPRSSPTPPVPNPGGNGTTNPGPTAPATSPSPEPKLPVTPGVLVPGKSLVSNSCMYSKRRLVKLCVQVRQTA